MLGSILLAAQFARVALLKLTSGVVGGDIDGYENMWDNYWVKTALFDLHKSVFSTDYLYYPTGISLRFHTLNPFNGLITLPFNLTLGYIPTINLFFYFSLVFTTITTFLLIRDLVDDAWAGFAGAAVFTYASILVYYFFISGQHHQIHHARAASPHRRPHGRATAIVWHVWRRTEPNAGFISALTYPAR